VPKGSVLGLCCSSSVDGIPGLYEDDFFMHRQIGSLADAVALQNDLSMLEE